MLIHGNSFRLSLADKSIHCAVTSPPYWGLRDYSLPPQIFGGRRDCRHIWGEKQASQQNDSNRHTLNWLTGGDPAVKTKGEKTSLGQFCQLCTAWRGSLGNEPTLELYVQNLVEVGREVWRVLRDDGIFWLNLGDSYMSNPGNGRGGGSTLSGGNPHRSGSRRESLDGLKPKNLCGIPWRVALALQDDGWILRRDIIWAKPNPMPEGVTDRATTAHEYAFMLVKRPRYFYDAEAVREPHSKSSLERHKYPNKSKAQLGKEFGVFTYPEGFLNPSGRNLRSVWTIATESYPGAHFATFPKKLVEPMIKASTSQRGTCAECGAQWERAVESTPIITSKESNNLKLQSPEVFERGGNQAKYGQVGSVSTKTTGWQPSCNCNVPAVPAVVLDPFCGSGTTGEVCRGLGRRFIGIDLSAEYLARNAMPRAERKTSQAALAELPLFEGL